MRTLNSLIASPTRGHWQAALRVLAGAGLLSTLSLASAAEPNGVREALLMPGKETLYQRVLTRPGARLSPAPGVTGAAAPGVIPALSIFYVYDRRHHQDAEWIEIGSAAKGTPKGWLPADRSIDWKQTLTVAFTRTADREPTLFFRDQDYLAELMESERLVATIDQLREQITDGDLPPDFPVVSIEPATFVDPNARFYLLPILGSESVFMESGHEAQVLNVAAVTLQEGPEAGAAQKGLELTQRPEDMLKDFRAGIVFVIDTTQSMGPYIDRTRAAIRRIYRRLRDAESGESLSFALVGYRDNITAAPGLEYVTRVFATLADGRNEATFFDKVSSVTPASASSKGFNEDAYAGLLQAIDQIDWSGYPGRFIVLISDAGARHGKDKLGSTGLGPDLLRMKAQEQDQSRGGGKIAIYALHLLTKEGRHTHDQAAEQYRALTHWDGAGSLYFPVDGGAVDAFGAQVDALADSILGQLESARTGRLVEVPDVAEGNEIERKSALVGRAMQLAYLGRVSGSVAPRIINAWASDRDFVQQSQKCLDVRVLITKNQLSDLQETLEAILRAGQETDMNPRDFFGQLRGVAATLARDPTKVNRVQVKSLTDVGAIGEWLSDLPYASQIMNITETDWLESGFAEQQEVLDTIEGKMLLYRQIHDNTDRWVPLDETQTKGEAVTTIPLDALP